MKQLTQKQRQLIRELDEISLLLRLNYREIHRYEYEERTTRLELIRRHFVRGEVIFNYIFVDEILNDLLCFHFFGKRRTFPKLWRTKRFRNFNYFLLERLSLMEKFAYVRAIRDVPKSVRSDVEQLNNLRNGIAHAFFPENLRSAKPRWKGLDVFSLEGMKRFTEDMTELTNFFVNRAFNKKIEKLS